MIESRTLNIAKQILMNLIRRISLCVKVRYLLLFHKYFNIESLKGVIINLKIYQIVDELHNSKVIYYNIIEAIILHLVVKLYLICVLLDWNYSCPWLKNCTVYSVLRQISLLKPSIEMFSCFNVSSRNGLRCRILPQFLRRSGCRGQPLREELSSLEWEMMTI